MLYDDRSQSDKSQLILKRTYCYRITSTEIRCTVWVHVFMARSFLANVYSRTPCTEAEYISGEKQWKTCKKNIFVVLFRQTSLDVYREEGSLSMDVSA